jgi:hypothetical protein
MARNVIHVAGLFALVEPILQQRDFAAPMLIDLAAEHR